MQKYGFAWMKDPVKDIAELEAYRNFPGLLTVWYPDCLRHLWSPPQARWCSFSDTCSVLEL